MKFRVMNYNGKLARLNRGGSQVEVKLCDLRLAGETSVVALGNAPKELVKGLEEGSWVEVTITPIADPASPPPLIVEG